LESISNSNFDLDFRNGKEGEDLVANVLGVETVEVKRDLMWFKTGNLYLETYCWNNTEQKEIPSGIRVTKSQWWFWVLGNTIIAVPTQQLKDLLNEQRENGTLWEIKNSKLPNPSRGVLIKVNDLLRFQKQIGHKINKNDTPVTELPEST
jgi:hypothetical protein